MASQVDGLVHAGPHRPVARRPGLVELTLAAANVGAALLVALGVRDWARTGRRSMRAVGDVVVGVTIVLAVLFVTPVLTVGAIGALAIAGCCVAAARNATR